MPAVAIMVCQRCEDTSRQVLADHHAPTTMPPCPSCGGHRQVSRVIYDRRARDYPVAQERRSSSGD